MKDLIYYREEIDKADDAILENFIKRMEISSKIADCKKKAGLNVRDEKREKEKLDNIETRSPEEFKKYTRDLFEFLMEKSRDYQSRKIERKE